MKAQFHIPFYKRLFDVTVTSILLLCLSPLFLLVALLIRLESRGPVFYYSKRVGQGYHIFNFYKFRSMRQDADQLLDKMQDLNQYAGEQKEVKTKTLSRTDIANQNCEGLLVADGEFYPEKDYEQLSIEKDRQSFVKIKNDPRITRVGRFIRNTSIDELPQLINILKGDMSLVGNRPLPVYEAEKLTTDTTIERFMAPAGLTGLWQVTERGKDSVTPENRCQLDIQYAREYSFWMDMKILVKTPLAALQHENV